MRGAKKCTIAAILKSETGKGGDHYELEKQISSWSIHGSRHVGGDVFSAERRSAAGRLVGAVSHDGWDMGNFRFALRETEIKSCAAFDVHRRRER